MNYNQKKCINLKILKLVIIYKTNILPLFYKQLLKALKFNKYIYFNFALDFKLVTKNLFDFKI